MPVQASRHPPPRNDLVRRPALGELCPDSYAFMSLPLLPDSVPPPPLPFDDSHIDPTLFPSPPPLTSTDLFSPAETTDFFGFLDNFGWDLEPQVQDSPPSPFPDTRHDPAPASPLPQVPENGPVTRSKGKSVAHDAESPSDTEHGTRSLSHASSNSPDATSSSHGTRSDSVSGSRTPKPLLSAPQKRLNHIMSEQKRRNAIRDGYLQLTTLLAPAGAPPGTGMPTRGRPKGSGSRGRGTKGKSGILFRAREYIHWLEEGQAALSEEVLRLEAAAGIRN